MKDLIVQILAMVSEQERNESKRRQAQGIQVAKEKGVYKDALYYIHLMLKILKNVLSTIVLLKMLEEGKAISKIAKELISQDRQFIELKW